MIAERIENDLRRQGKILEGHFVLAAGDHSKQFVSVKELLPSDTFDYCGELAQRFQTENINLVIGPASGATILARQTAVHLRRIHNRFIPGLYIPKDDQKNLYIPPKLKSKFSGQRILIVEDVTTSGSSIQRVYNLVTGRGGIVVGIGTIVNRGRITDENFCNKIRLESLLVLPVTSWPEADCPLCKQGMPISTQAGRGQEYLNRLAMQNA